MDQILRHRAALALVLLPLALPFLLIAFLGVNMLLWDEFFYTDFVRSVRAGGNWLPWLWTQHNEHRVIAMKLLMVPNALFLHWNRQVEMYCSAALILLLVLGLWTLYRRSGGSDLLLFAPVAWMACSLSQYENLLYGMMTCHWITVVGIVWALVCLDRPGRGGFAAAVFFGFLASFSILNGFLVWPVGLFLLWARRRWPAAALWGALGLAAVGLYRIGFQMPGGRPPLDLSAHAVAKTGLFALISLGAPLAAGSVAWGFVVGGLLAVLAAATVVGWWRHGRERIAEEALPAALFLFGGLSTAMVAAGRASMSVPALQPRYITYSTLALAGGYLLLCAALRRRGETPAASPGFVAVLGLLGVGLAAANLHGFDQARDWRLARIREKFLLLTIDRQADEDLTGLYFQADLRRLASYLRRERLGPFADPQDVLLLIRWHEGAPLGEILPGHAVEQTLVCPVEELRDVAVAFATYGRQSSSAVRLTVEAGDRRLGARTVFAAGLRDNEWIKVALDRPLRGCRGTVLRIRAEAPAAAPGNAVTLWTYSPYYEGTLHQGSATIPDHNLGVMLNAFHSGIL